MSSVKRRSDGVKATDLVASEDSISMKRLRLENSESSEHDDADPKISAISDKGESCAEKALRNGLILHKIFINLRTSFLISTCSLVDKTWNAEARKFVRSHRRCTTKYSKETTACEFLQKLDRLCALMVRNGRVVPFNYMKIDFSKVCKKVTEKKNDEILYGNLMSELKLKGLTVSGGYLSDCEYHKPVLTFLKNKATELKSLEVRSTVPFASFAAANDWCPQFLVLEELSVGCIYSLDNLWPPLSQRMQWLLKDAPNLKRILPTSLRCLKYLPEEALAPVTLHGELVINQELDLEDVNRLYAVSEKFCGLKVLSFYDPTRDLVEDDDDYDGISEDGEEEPLQLEAENRRCKYNNALERVLKTAQHSLEAIETNSAYPLSKISHPPLLNLSKLVLSWNAPQDWCDIASINFDLLMPRLQEVELNIVNFELREVRGAQLYGSTTVRALSLVLETEDFNLGLLKPLFPSVSVLNLTLKTHWPRWWAPRQEWTYAPVTAVCGNWPGLEEFKITGPVTCLNRNYDTYFCGISAAEVALLKEQDDDYLKRVQIVPSRPCLLTLPKLRDFWFVQDLFADSDPEYASEHPEGFVSRVTQLVVFDRNPNMNVCLPYFTRRGMLTVKRVEPRIPMYLFF